MKTKTSQLQVINGRNILFLLILVVSFSSCVKDNFDFNKIAEIKYNPNFAVPLVHSSLSLDEILLNIEQADGFLTEEADKSLTVTYKSNFNTLDASALSGLSLPSPSATVPTVVIPPGAATLTPTQTVGFTTSNPTKIDSITFKAGSLDFSFSGFSSSAQLIIAIPAAIKNGVAFSQSVTLPISSTSFDLTGYTFDMTQVGGPPYNQFDINFTIATTAGPGGTLDMSIGMNNLQFSRLFGDLQSLSIASHKDTLDLSIFKNALGAASFSLTNPKAKVIAHNSFGLPIDISFQQLEGENPGIGTYPIPNSTPFPINITSPSLAQVGQTLTDTTTLDNGNSQIASVFNSTPQRINYEITAATNTGSPSQNQFVLDTSKFSIDLLMELPLEGTANGFSLVDTLPFELGESLSDNMEYGIIRIYSSNGFPIDLNLQVYFADDAYTKLDSLMGSSQVLLKSGSVDGTGKVTTPTENTVDIKVDRAKFANLSKGKYLILKASIGTTNGGATPVKIYSDYLLEVKLGVQLQVDAKVNPNN